MYYILLRSKSTFLNHSRGHLSLCCYRCFINVLALNFFLERSNLKKSDPCVFALIIDCFYVRHLVGMEKKLLSSTNSADLSIFFITQIMVVYLYFYFKLEDKAMRFPGNYISFFKADYTYLLLHTYFYLFTYLLYLHAQNVEYLFYNVDKDFRSNFCSIFYRKHNCFLRCLITLH